MRGNGITYDTGFINGGASTHEPFRSDTVRRDMVAIHDDLHCNVVRVTGGDARRIEIAARHAAAVGLEVWFCPFTCDLGLDELLTFVIDCARSAESLRHQHAAVVLLVGSELSLFNKGFLPGETLQERLGILTTPDRIRELLPRERPRINEFLNTAAAVARATFGGKISYASLPFEAVDWTPFDIISTDAGYRSADNAERFVEDIRAFVARGRALSKPVAITEFGCCTYRGAADQGGRGDRILEWQGARPVRLNGTYIRDEDEQAAYLVELLDIFNREGVDTAFVNTFARYDLPHGPDPREDLDMASYGVVRVLPDRLNQARDVVWEPKVAFEALARYYAGSL
jgi:hypothetical protein